MASAEVCNLRRHRNGAHQRPLFRQFYTPPGQRGFSVHKFRVSEVITLLHDYIARHQSRLMLNIEASVKETPSRILLVAAIYAMMTQFAPLALAIACFVIGLADDGIMYWAHNRLRRQMRNREFIILALSNIIGATAFATFLAHIMVTASDPVAQIATIVIFMATLVELASPKAGRHAFAFLTLGPVWIAMNVSIVLVIVHSNAMTASMATGFLVLGIVAVHSTLMFWENAKRMGTLMQETIRANVANEQKGRFLSAISHEIRTPLHAVYGTAQLLQNTTDPQELRRLAQILQIAAADMKAIVDDVIDYSQITGGQLNVRPVATDPVAIALRTADLFRANAEAKGLLLRVEVAQGAPRVMAMLDPVRVGQALANLLSHAIGTTEQGSVVIRVVLPEANADPAKVQDRTATMIRYMVDDGGPTLSLADRNRILDGEDISGCADGGTPLGARVAIAISKLLAEAMGGGVCATEAPQSGTRFTLGLPLVPAPTDSPAVTDIFGDERQPPDAVTRWVRTLPSEPAATLPMPVPTTESQAPQPAAPQAKAPSVLNGLRVLVVDDVAINREVLRAMLERQGAEVHEAEDGQQGLDQIDRHSFDLVMLDNMMPVMSGCEMLSKLRKRPGPEANVIVVGISAGTLSEERDAFLGLGLDAFLSKPVSFNELTGLLQTILSKRKACDPDGKLCAIA